MNNTLKKVDKLRKRQEFLKLQSQGNRVSNRHFIVMVAPGSTDRTRLGITVTKKVGQATVRNRIKRLTREYFRKNKSTFIKSWDMNLIAKKSISDLDSDQVFSALEDIFQRIRKSFEH